MLIEQLVRAHTDDGTVRYHRSRAVRWAVHLTRDGNAQLIDRADSDHKSGPPMSTPYVVRASGDTPTLLVDTMEYVLGIAENDTAAAQTRADKRHANYLALLQEWNAASGDPIAATVIELFSAQVRIELAAQARIREAASSDLVCLVIDAELVHMCGSAVEFWAQVARTRKGSGVTGVCLSCGEVGPLLKSVPDMVKGHLIPVGIDAKGQPKRGRDAALVSINTSAQGRSGRKQLVNTPLCEDCGGRAISALNTMLADQNHRRRGDDTVFVWWLRTRAAFNPLIIDDPDPNDVTTLLNEINTIDSSGAFEDNEFYGLLLSANQSRVIVRDWIDVPLTRIKARLAEWFTDHESTQLWDDGVHAVALWRMVQASGRWDRGSEKYVAGSAVRGLERDLLRCALHGSAPPPSLVPQLLHRIRNDHRIDAPRVAMLRLALTRPPYKETVMPGLDDTATDPGYVWGRMFAVLEAIQRKAIPDINTTIRDKYLALAMSRPEATMRTLRLGANGHLKKLRGTEATRGAGYALDAKLAVLSEHLQTLPALLDGHGQIRFILGYDHQRAADMAAARAAKAAK
ncbi:type I-C CRISPR-associated protein Cas8c/Csd1 [Nocardia miyunensis]|uniref:type I-C CRISPR-associated protein Cas8c/Csd1 n=1 Tax=Nocardia miyunensis TaxID=282684 RepID=UPI00082F3CEC|nr:type I-C CRISPR-associated protein Cas8c/Csd1 [Nocardia miyunensis]